MRRIGVVFAIIFSLSADCRAQSSGFQDLGIPVRSPLPMSAVVGADQSGGNVVAYLNVTVSASHPTIVAINLRSGKVDFYPASIDDIAFAMLTGPDGRIYLATSGTGSLLRFDPKSPSQGLVNLGRFSPNETYIFQMTSDGKKMIYGGTFPHARIIGFDTQTGAFRDLGVIAEGESYVRTLAMDQWGNLVAGTGTREMGVFIVDASTLQRRNVLPSEFRKPGYPIVKMGSDNNVYVQVGYQLFLWNGQKLLPVAESVYPGDLKPKLADGRILQGYFGQPDTLGIVLRGEDGKDERRPFRFTGDGARLFYVSAGSGGRVYGGSIMPNRVFVCSSSGETLELGNPVEGEWGETYSSVAIGHEVVFAAYSGGVWAVYDETRPWRWGKTLGSNPLFLGGLGDGHDRPRAIASDGRSRAFVGSTPGYGELGGGLAVIDAVQKRVVWNGRNIVPRQSIASLCYDPETGLLYGGTSVMGGGGSSPTEKEGRVFVWDPSSHQLRKSFVPVPGDNSVIALTLTGRKLIGVTRESSTLFVYDLSTQKLTFLLRIPWGMVPDLSLGTFGSNICYGIAGNSIFKFDVTSSSLSLIAQYPGKIECGFALADQYIYFGSGAHLIRYRIQ